MTAGNAGKTALKLTEAGKRRFKGHGKTKLTLVLRDASALGAVKVKY